QLLCVGPRVAGPPSQQVLAKPRLQAAREPDDTLAVSGHLLHVDGRLAALKALQKARGGELDQVAVARGTRSKESQVKLLEPARRPAAVVIDQVHLTADDGLYAVLAACRVELDGAVHDAVIGERERGLPECCRPLRKLIDFARPVEQRVLGVDV